MVMIPIKLVSLNTGSAKMERMDSFFSSIQTPCSGRCSISLIFLYNFQSLLKDYTLLLFSLPFFHTVISGGSKKHMPISAVCIPFLHVPYLYPRASFIFVFYFPSISSIRYSDLHPVLNLIAQSEIPDVTIKFVLPLFSYP